MTNTEIKQKDLLELSQAVTGFEKALVESLRLVPLSLAPYTLHLSNSLGKNLRGKALILAASNEEGMVEKDAISLAVAIELFHLATLVHDDIIDDANIRRGQDSLQKKFGKKVAVLLGDYLFAQAMELGSGINKNREIHGFSFSSYARMVCVGEIRQGANNLNFDLSVFRYLSIIRGKTAALFEAAFAGGGWILGDKLHFESYKKLGRYMGMIFQMMDDLIDIEQSVEQAKKPILSDLNEGVITLPLILAMKEDKDLKPLLLAQKEKNSFDPVLVQQKVFRANGHIQTRALAQRYYDLAIKELDAMALSTDKYNKLLALLNKAAGKEDR